MKRTLLAAVAAVALLAALPAAEPISAQSNPTQSTATATTTETCTAVVTGSRVVSERRDGNFIDQQLIEQTVVDRCTSVAGTVDRNERRVRFWQNVQEFDSGTG